MGRGIEADGAILWEQCQSPVLCDVEDSGAREEDLCSQHADLVPLGKSNRDAIAAVFKRERVTQDF